MLLVLLSFVLRINQAIGTRQKHVIGPSLREIY